MTDRRPDPDGTVSVGVVRAERVGARTRAVARDAGFGTDGVRQAREIAARIEFALFLVETGRLGEGE